MPKTINEFTKMLANILIGDGDVRSIDEEGRDYVIITMVDGNQYTILINRRK